MGQRRKVEAAQRAQSTTRRRRVEDRANAERAVARAAARPARPEPVARLLASVSASVGEALDAEFAAAGGSRPVWLVLAAVRQGAPVPSEAARLAGALERAGLVRRDAPTELTEEGEALYQRLRRAAMSFDRRLRRGLRADEIEACRDVLARLRANVAAE